MAAPAFVKAGTGVTIASGSAACTVATTTAGNTIILQVLQDGTAASAVTLSALTNVENLADTASAMTVLAAAQPVGSPTAALQHLYIGRSLGGTVSVTVATTGDDLYYRLYELSGASTATTLAAVTESIANGAGTGTTVSDTGVTVTGGDRLALQLVAVNDDLAVGPFTGMTGGTWAEAVAEFASATGTDGCIQLQTGSINGGFITPGNTLNTNIGPNTNSEQRAIRVVAPGTGILTTCSVKMKVAGGAPTDDVILEIQTDSGGFPSGTVVGTPITVNVVGTTNTVYPAAVQAPVTSGSTYWLVIRRSGALDASNWYAAELAASGNTVVLRNAGTWITTAQSLACTVEISAGTINGGTFTMASGGWGVVGLALLPVAPVGPVTLERQAALAAVGLIAAIGREELARLAAVNATGAVVASGVKVTPGVTIERAVIVAATGLIAAAGRELLPRAAVFNATGAIASSGFSVVKASVVVNATAAIATVGRETLARTAAVAASAQIASAGREQLARLAELAAATNISVSGVRVAGGVTVQRSAAFSVTGSISTVGRETLARSAAVAASAGIATIGRELLPRAAVITAQGSITAAGQKRLQRSAAVTTTAAVTAAGEQEGFVARTAALAAAAAVTAAGEVEGAAERAASLAATAAVTASGIVVHVRQRSAAIVGTGALTTASQRALQRAATVSSSATVATVGRKLLSRTAALDGNASITTTAGGNIGQASLSAISTITVTLPWPAGAISTPTTGLVSAGRRGGIYLAGRGEIATGSDGQLARTGG